MSHTSLFYHIIFRTKYSEPTISELNEQKLYAYISGIIKNKKSILYIIGGKSDHIHILVSIPPNIAISDFMKVLKTETSKWIKESGYFPKFLGWGSGYAVFSCSYEEKDEIINYIKNQKEHHRKVEFAEEIRTIFNKNNVKLNEKYFERDWIL